MPPSPSIPLTTNFPICSTMFFRPEICWIPANGCVIEYYPLRRVSNMVILRCFVLSGLAVVSTSALWAQSTGQISGTVKDQAEKPVANALVSLYRLGTSDPIDQRKTNAAGIFFFSALNPESYTLVVEAEGMAKSQQDLTV